MAPPSTPLGSDFKVAARLELEPLPPTDGGTRLIAPTSGLSTDHRANRLDRPPRIAGLA
jgi:hypothetical protein